MFRSLFSNRQPTRYAAAVRARTRKVPPVRPLLEILEDRRLLAGPNLVPSVNNFNIVPNFVGSAAEVAHGCVPDGAAHKILRFAQWINNKGDQTFIVNASPATSPYFEWHPVHGHWHIRDFTEYELISGTGAVATKLGSKLGYNIPGNQILPGGADVYGSGTPCQYFIIDGIPNGIYLFRLSLSLRRTFTPETDYADNTILVGLNIQGNTVTPINAPPPDFRDTLSLAWNTGVGPAIDGRVIAWNNNAMQTVGSHIGDGDWGARDVDFYSFEAHAGSTVSLRTALPQVGTSMDTLLRVFRRLPVAPFYEELPGGYNDDCAPGNLYSCINNLPIPATGTYFAGVSGYGNRNYNPTIFGTSAIGDTGDYTLRIQLNNLADVPETIGTALNTGMGPAAGSSYVRPSESVGWSHHGVWDQDIYKFQATGGTTLTAQTSLPPGGAPADTVLRLFNASGTQLPGAVNDDCPSGGLYSCLTYAFSAPGTHTYYAGVTGYRNGHPAYTPIYDPNFKASGIAAYTSSLGDYRLNLGLSITPTVQITIALQGISISAGTPFVVLVTARDAAGNPNPAYRGTVSFTSPDDQRATLPQPYEFQASDNGVRAFQVTLRTAGSRTVVINDGQRSGRGPFLVNPAEASRFDVIPSASSIVAGTPFAVTLTARDAWNNVATGYRGTVAFTSSDPQATRPANYSFAANDNGTRTFQGVVFRTAGNQTLTARDTVNGSISGAATLAASPAAASRLFLTAVPVSTIAGTPFSVIVTATDQYGNRATGYRGTVRFTSSDGRATLPDDYPFAPADAGTRTFSGLVLRSAGSRLLGVHDPNDASLFDTASVFVLPAAAVTLTFSGVPATLTAGVASPGVVVTARDAYSNVATGYTGTVTFTTSDPWGGTLPTDYTFTSGDAGVHTFAEGVTLYAAGQQIVTVTDTLDAGLTDTVGVLVNPNVAAYFYLEVPASVLVGTPFDLTLYALDAYFNIATGYTGTATFTSSDLSASLPSDYPFTPGDAGIVSFPSGATLYTEGDQDITVTDTVDPTLVGWAVITVVPGSAPGGSGSGGRFGGPSEVAAVAPLLASEGAGTRINDWRKTGSDNTDATRADSLWMGTGDTLLDMRMMLSDSAGAELNLHYGSNPALEWFNDDGAIAELLYGII